MSRTMTTRRGLFTGAAAAAALGFAGSGSATAGPVSAGAPATGPMPSGLQPPLQFGYFRTWHDRAADPTRPNCIAELPPEVDIAIVFPDFTPPESPFWTALRDTYVPELHAQGTKVVQTTGIHAILNADFPDTPEGHRAQAESIVEHIVDARGLDGLDVDMESTLSQQELAKASGVFQELSTLIGPLSGTGKLFLYDTNKSGSEPIFAQNADCFDYVLVQSYGRSLSGLQATWNSYAPHIASEQYLIGFSFYEENGANWGDTTEPFEESRAAAYATWQPEGETKGGIFSYAVDRDGVPIGDDEIVLTTYGWSKKLKQRMIS